MTTTYDDEELLAGLDEPLRCECEHRSRQGTERRCDGEATHIVVVLCMAEGREEAAEVYLLCRDCMTTWRREHPHRLRITPL